MAFTTVGPTTFFGDSNCVPRATGMMSGKDEEGLLWDEDIKNFRIEMRNKLQVDKKGVYI